MTSFSVLKQQAYNYVFNRILNLDIAPGSRIREDIIAAELNMSRTPVREAINLLIQNGLITNIERRGLYCIRMTKADLEEIMDIRLSLENLAIKKCIENATEEDIDYLRDLVHQFKTAGIDELKDIHNSLDIKFHVKISQMSKSTRLEKYITEIENQLLIVRNMIFSNIENKKIWNTAWEEHEQLIEKIQQKDDSGAFMILEQHSHRFRMILADFEKKYYIFT